MALFRQLEEAAQQISLKGDAPDEDFVGKIITTIEDLTGIDLSILRGALDGIDSLIGGIQTTLNQIGDIFNNLVVTPINNVVSNVKNWFLNLLGFRSDTSTSLDIVDNDLQNQGTAIVGLATTIDGKANYYDIPNNQPYWMTTNPLEDVTFPRADLDNSPKAVNIWGGDNGRYVRPVQLNINGTPDIAVTTEPFYWPIPNTWEIAFIRAPRDRIYNQVSFMLGAPDKTPAAACKVVVGKMSLQTGKVGDLIPLWQVEDITPSTSNLKHQRVLQLGQDFEARAGEPWFVAILQGAGSVKPIGGKNLNDIIAPELVFPPKQKASVTFPNAIAASTGLGFFGEIPVGIARNELSFADNWVPWCSLGEAVVQGAAPALYYDEDFNLPDQNGYGPAWYTTGQNQGISSGAAVSKGTKDGLRSAQYVFALNYDDQEVEGQSTGSIDNNAPATLFLRTSLNMRSGVGFQFSNSRVELYSFIGGYPSGVVSRKSSNYTVPNGALLRIRAVGNVYTAYVNGDLALSWTDSGNVMPKGSAYRFWGFGVSRSAFFNSSGWGSLTASDIIVEDQG